MEHGTRNLVAAAEVSGVGRFILMSALGLDERSKDAVPYFTAKWEMERAVRSSSLQYVVFRPSFVFGDDGGVLPTFVRLARYAPVTPIVGDGTRRFQPIWVEDVAQYLAQAVSHPDVLGRTFELGGPEATTWNGFWERLKRVLGSRRPSIHVPVGLMRAQAALTDWLPAAPVTRDQLTMLELGDNVVVDPARSRCSSSRSSRSTSSCAARCRDARRRLRRAGRCAGRRGDRSRRSRAARGAGAHRGVRSLPLGRSRRRDGRLGDALPDPPRSRGRRCRRGGRPRGDVGGARRPRGRRVAGAVRRVPVVSPRRRAAVLVPAPREASRAPRGGRGAAHSRPPLRDARRSRDRARGVRRPRSGRASGRASLPARVRILDRCRRGALDDAGSRRLVGRRHRLRRRRISRSCRARGSRARSGSSPSTSPRRSSRSRASSARPTSSTRPRPIRSSRCASSPAASSTRSRPSAHPWASPRRCACAPTPARRRSSASRRRARRSTSISTRICSCRRSRSPSRTAATRSRRRTSRSSQARRSTGGSTSRAS